MNAPVQPDSICISVSQIKEWMLCPKKHALHYRLGAQAEHLPVPLAFGSAFHAALAYHYGWLMRGEPVPADEAKQRFVDAMHVARQGEVPLLLDDDEGDAGFEAILAKGLVMLDVTLGHPSARPEKVLGVEVPFIVDLYDPDTGEVVDAKLRGFLDLVLLEDDHRVVVEHKTSSRRYSQEQLSNDTQLAAYAYAAGQLGFGEVGLRFSVTCKTKVPALVIDDVRRDDADQADFLRQAVGVLRAIDAGVSFPVRSWACRSCQYRRRCESER